VIGPRRVRSTQRSSMPGRRAGRPRRRAGPTLRTTCCGNAQILFDKCAFRMVDGVASFWRVRCGRRQTRDHRGERSMS